MALVVVDELSTPNRGVSALVGASVDEVVVGELVNGLLDGNGPSTEFDSVDVPTVGMCFETVQAAEDFYCSYAKAFGFGIIRKGGYTSKTTNERKWQYWHCECGPPLTGKKKAAAEAKQSENVRRRKSKKCGCGAGMSANFNQDGVWEIKSVELTHTNHNPTPSKSRFVPGHRSIPKYMIRFITDLLAAGVTQQQVYVALANQLNGFENVPFLLSDLNNLVTSERVKKFRNGDCEAMFEYFHKMQEENPDFFFDYRLTEDETQLKDLVWIDARSRSAYKYFSDVVCFDATYITNNYELPFANFVGVNHHGQTILLGCALISRENAETYKWVMQTWLRGMSGVAPGGIITDQSQAMRIAIDAVFPNTVHRLCVWHILNKVPKKLVWYRRVKQFHKEFRGVVYDSLTEAEFEERWAKLIAEHNLEENDWLNGLYDDKERWVPAFVKDRFWAGMSTTQRVESIHHFFKGFMDRKTLLRDFVEKYTRAIHHRMNAEDVKDNNDERRVAKLVTDLPVEIFFQNLYTDAKFKEVQAECSGLVHVVPSPHGYRRLSADVVQYDIIDKIWVGEEASRFLVTRVHKVIYNENEEDFRCECRLFEHRGIVCRHLIRLMDMLELTSVPQKYVLDRWRKDIKRDYKKIKVAFNDPLRSEDAARYGKLQFEFENVFQVAMDSPQLCNYAVEAARRLLDELEALRTGSQVDGNTEHEDNNNLTQDGPVSGVGDPTIVTRAGRPRKNSNHGPGGTKRARSRSTGSTQASVTQPPRSTMPANLDRRGMYQRLVLDDEDPNMDVPAGSTQASVAQPPQTTIPANLDRSGMYHRLVLDAEDPNIDVEMLQGAHPEDDPEDDVLCSQQSTCNNNRIAVASGSASPGVGTRVAPAVAPAVAHSVPSAVDGGAMQPLMFSRMSFGQLLTTLSTP